MSYKRKRKSRKKPMMFGSSPLPSAYEEKREGSDVEDEGEEVACDVVYTSDSDDSDVYTSESESDNEDYETVSVADPYENHPRLPGVGQDRTMMGYPNYSGLSVSAEMAYPSAPALSATSHIGSSAIPIIAPQTEDDFVARAMEEEYPKIGCDSISHHIEYGSNEDSTQISVIHNYCLKGSLEELCKRAKAEKSTTLYEKIPPHVIFKLAFQIALKEAAPYVHDQMSWHVLKYKARMAYIKPIGGPVVINRFSNFSNHLLVSVDGAAYPLQSIDGSLRKFNFMLAPMQNSDKPISFMLDTAGCNKHGLSDSDVQLFRYANPENMKIILQPTQGHGNQSHTYFATTNIGQTMKKYIREKNLCGMKAVLGKKNMSSAHSALVTNVDAARLRHKVEEIRASIHVLTTMGVSFTYHNEDGGSDWMTKTSRKSRIGKYPNKAIVGVKYTFKVIV